MDTTVNSSVLKGNLREIEMKTIYVHLSILQGEKKITASVGPGCRAVGTLI